MEERIFDRNESLFREPPEAIGPEWYRGFLLGGIVAFREPNWPHCDAYHLSC